MTDIFLSVSSLDPNISNKSFVNVEVSILGLLSLDPDIADKSSGHVEVSILGLLSFNQLHLTVSSIQWRNMA
jgi:hypothetical protein